MCSYAPSALKEALQFQESLGVYPDLIIRGQGENNNEVVLDTRWITKVPHVVLAFFYRRRIRTRRARRSYESTVATFCACLGCRMSARRW